MTFWGGAGIMLACVLARFLWAALRPKVSAPWASKATYQNQQAALARAAADGEVTADHLPELESDLARATLDDAAHETRAPFAVSAEERYGLGLLVIMILPIIAIPLYLKLGTPNLSSATAPPEHMTAVEMIKQLEARIEQAPQDPEPRLWLARVHMVGARYAEAVKVFEELNALAPDQPAIMLQFADALAMTHNGTIGDKALGLIHRAIELEPANVTGLWLAGVAADQAGKADQALDYLQRARRASLDADAESPTEELDNLIAEIESRHGVKSASPPVATAGATAPASITVEVSVDATQVAGLPPDSVVYVLAKAVTGPPMPLAVKRLRLAELPQRVTLDDSLAMAPQFKLSSATEVIVTARVSRSGEPIAHSGDVEGKSAPLAVGPAATVAITIDTKIP